MSNFIALSAKLKPDPYISAKVVGS